MWILERPLPILFLGVVLVAILVGGLVQTGRRWLLLAIGAAVLLTAGMLVLERLVVTPAEQVEATLRRIADDIARNDVEAVIASISPGRPELRQEARRHMNLVTISDVTIKANLRVQVLSDRNPPLAEARFNAVIRGTDRAGQLGTRIYPRFFVVNFRQEDGQWRVRGYAMHDPREGLSSR
jgi:hypothetical protein